jgi:hypothetical protein
MNPRQQKELLKKIASIVKECNGLHPEQNQFHAPAAYAVVEGITQVDHPTKNVVAKIMHDFVLLNSSSQNGFTKKEIWEEVKSRVAANGLRTEPIETFEKEWKRWINLNNRAISPIFYFSKEDRKWYSA